MPHLLILSFLHLFLRRILTKFLSVTLLLCTAICTIDFLFFTLRPRQSWSWGKGSLLSSRRALYCLCLPLRVLSSFFFSSSPSNFPSRWRCNWIFLPSLYILFNLWLIASFRILMTAERVCSTHTQYNRKLCPNILLFSLLSFKSDWDLLLFLLSSKRWSFLDLFIQSLFLQKWLFFMSWHHVSPAIFLFNEYTNKRGREVRDAILFSCDVSWLEMTRWSWKHG